ncbi:MAG: hypothetical protein E7559_10110 [Ruminococcaceae bacterium]|nr:hypothetical protein [Oscillospiraceae bacterium]
MSNTTFATTTKAGKVILWIVGIILALLIVVGAAGLLTFSAATRDTMPLPSVSPTDMKEFALDAAKEVVTDNKITVEAADIDTVLATVKDTVNGSTDMFEVRDLFSSLQGNKGTIYARVYIDTINVKGIELKLDKVLPVQVDFGVSFDAPSIVVVLDQFKCGSITIPQSIIDSVLGSVALPEEMTVKNGNIYYDTSNLDSMIDGILEASITNAVNNSGIVSFLGNIFGEDAAANIADQAASALTGVASKATNVELNNAYIEDGALIIEGKVF